jgi:histidine triad (HIT) family protein
MPTIFSKIIAGEIPCYKVAETNDFMAFLDVRPLTAGHTLIIPKTETDYIFDIDDEHYAGLFLFAKIVAGAVKKAIPCTKVGMAVIGLEVPHVHVHLIPLRDMQDMRFVNKEILTPDKFEEIAKKVSEKINF